MIDINKLLDTARKSCGVTSDNALAIRLEVERSTVSGWRHGKALPDVASTEKLAKMTGIKPLAAVLDIQEQREISRDAKAVWRRLASAAAVLLLVGFGAPGEAKSASQEARDYAPSMHYANFWYI